MRTLTQLVLVSLLLVLVACDDDSEASSPVDASTSVDGAASRDASADAAPFDLDTCLKSGACAQCASGTAAIFDQPCEPADFTCWTACTDGYHRRLGCSDGAWGGEKGRQACGDPLDASTDASN